MALFGPWDDAEDALWALGILVFVFLVISSVKACVDHRWAMLAVGLCLATLYPQLMETVLSE